MEGNMDILNKVRNYREEENQLKWEGTFEEFLAIVKERPEVAQTAHARVYSMIKNAGLTELDNKKQFTFFENEIFGLEESLERLVEEYFHPAARTIGCTKTNFIINGSSKWRKVDYCNTT